MQTRDLGIAVVGSGRIGSLRAQMAAQHPAVKFLAVSDLSADRAAAVAEKSESVATSVMTPQVATQPLLLPLTELMIMPAIPATQITAAPPRNQLIGIPPCCQTACTTSPLSARFGRRAPTETISGRGACT